MRARAKDGSRSSCSDIRMLVHARGRKSGVRKVCWLDVREQASVTWCEAMSQASLLRQAGVEVAEESAREGVRSWTTWELYSNDRAAASSKL